jgi:hypothetical protein
MALIDIDARYVEHGGVSMAILTDIFVSTPADAQRYQSLQPKRSSGLFELVQFKGLTNLEFGILWAIISGEDFDFDKHALESLAPQEETWLFRFPTVLVQKLAALTPVRINEISAAWADTEELQWAPAQAKEVIVQLVRLAKLAPSPSKGLFFWGSL